MLKTFYCADGTVFASTRSHSEKVTVDEVIAFLEQHRGKEFVNGAAETTSFRADDTVVSCDTFEFWMGCYEDMSYASFIDDWFCEFYGDEVVGRETDYSQDWCD